MAEKFIDALKEINCSFTLSLSPANGGEGGGEGEEGV